MGIIVGIIGGNGMNSLLWGKNLFIGNLIKVKMQYTARLLENTSARIWKWVNDIPANYLAYVK